VLIIIATVVSIVIGAIGLIATVGHGVKWIFRRGEVSGRAEVEHAVEVRTVADRLSDLEGAAFGYLQVGAVPRHACSRGVLSRPADPSPQATRREG